MIGFIILIFIKCRSGDKDPKNKTTQSKTVPFEKLMDGVVFTLSGFPNPFRGELRQKALDMGATYKVEWDNTCTHLICAFVNTPKFNQTKSQSGKIVKKEWIEQSFADRKRYPWRRFCLDKHDKGIMYITVLKKYSDF